MRTTRLLIADGSALVRSGIACFLERHGYTIAGMARDGDETKKLWALLRPDLVILDPAMEQADPAATTRAIRKLDPGARIIILSANDNVEQAYKVLRAGAWGLLSKTAESEVLLQCIDSVIKGERFISAAIAEHLAFRDRATAPTVREFEVLVGVSEGLCNKRIGQRLGIEESTVKAHLSKLLHKLGASSRVEALAIAVRQGMVRL